MAGSACPTSARCATKRLCSVRWRPTRPRSGSSIGSPPSRVCWTQLRAAHAQARERFWKLHGAPERLTIDVDATLITAHSEKERAAGNYKGGYGFHPLAAYADETREALGALLRPGNAGANTAADHKQVLDLALEQIPGEHIESLQILVRCDSAGATHELADYCREAQMRFSVGYELTEPVRAAILEIPEDAWVPALDQDGGRARERAGRRDHQPRGSVLWPEGSQVDRAARAPAPRRAAVLHRPRRLPLPGDPHRPARSEHRDARVPPPPARARRGPHPRRQGHRPVQAAVQRVRRSTRCGYRS